MDILLTESQIAQRVAELGIQISRDYEGKTPLLVGVLKGSVVFLADLMRHIRVPCQVDFLQASSYGGGSESCGTVRIVKDVESNIAGRDLLVIEDILDTGTTLLHLKTMLEKRQARVKLCALLDKPSRRTSDVMADYIGFTIPDVFVVGYGLDYAENNRNLPFIGVLNLEQ